MTAGGGARVRARWSEVLRLVSPELSPVLLCVERPVPGNVIPHGPSKFVDIVTTVGHLPQQLADILLVLLLHPVWKECRFSKI